MSIDTRRTPFALRLTLARLATGLKVNSLASNLGLTETLYGELERGVVAPNSEMASRLANAFCIPVDWLIGNGPVFSFGDPVAPDPALWPNHRYYPYSPPHRVFTPRMHPDTFACRLYLVQVALLMSMEEMADCLGVSVGSVQRYIRGSGPPHPSTKSRIVEQLSVPLDWLMGQSPLFPWSTDVPITVPQKIVETGGDTRPTGSTYRPEDPIAVLYNAKYSDYELETLTREQQSLKKIASYIDGAIVTTDEERLLVKNTLSRLAEAYKQGCDRINAVMDTREKAVMIIDSFESSFERELFRRHFLHHESWEDVAAEMTDMSGSELRASVVLKIYDRLRRSIGNPAYTESDGWV